MALYVVTGGAGFIGSHMVEELSRRGERSASSTASITGHRRNLAHVKDVEFVEGDLADIDVARRGMAGADYVLHQAAIPSVPRSVDDPVTSNRANIDATLNVLVAARDAGVKRVVYAASSSAYGDSPTLPKHEEMPTAPLSPYALQKLVGEEYMQMFTSLYGLETVSIRYFNVFGPRQDPSSPYSGVISLFITALLAGKQPIIYGDGEQTPRLHLRRELGRRRAESVRGAERRRPSDQRGHGGAHFAESPVPHAARRDRRRTASNRSTSRGGPATSATRWPISPRRARC